MSPPRGSAYAEGPEGTPPPAKLFDFPGLHPGAVFVPDTHRPFLTAWWLPIIRWEATARIVSITEDRLQWTETNQLGPVPFEADVVLEREGDWDTTLHIAARLGPVPMPPLCKRYEIIGAQPNLILLRDLKHPRDMVSVGRQLGDVVQFHLRLPLRIAIHKSGKLTGA